MMDLTRLVFDVARHAPGTDTFEKRRRLENALSIVRRLSGRYSAAVDTVDEVEEAALMKECGAALSILQEDDLPKDEEGDLPKSEVGDGSKQPMGLPSKAQISAFLTSHIKRGASYRDVAACLYAFDVALCTALFSIGASPQLPPPAEPSVDATTLREGALLTAATEKFYSSGPFRLSKWMLTAAAALAFGGIITVGGVSYSVYEKANAAKSDIDEKANAAKSDIDRSVQKVDDKEKTAENLVAVAINNATSIVEEQLKQNNTIDKLNQLGKTSQEKIQQAREAGLTLLQNDIGEMRLKLTDINNTLQEDQAKVVALAKPLASLEASAQQAPAVARAVTAIRSDEETAHAAQLRADVAAHASADAQASALVSATAARTAAEQGQAAVQSLLVNWRRDVSDQVRRLDESANQATNNEAALRQATQPPTSAAQPGIGGSASPKP